LQNATLERTKIRAELITEVELGPFKHKNDDGIPIRKAAYALIDSMVEKLPKLSFPPILEVVIRGLEDPAEECLILCLHILGRLIQITPVDVIAGIEALVDSFER
jgi:cullin-associated NEDD8-dissociated protein 1